MSFSHCRMAGLSDWVAPARVRPRFFWKSPSWSRWVRARSFGEETSVRSAQNSSVPLGPSVLANCSWNSGSFLYESRVEFSFRNSAGDISSPFSLMSFAAASAFSTASTAASRSPYSAPEKPTSAWSAMVLSTRAALLSLSVALPRILCTSSRR